MPEAGAEYSPRTLTPVSSTQERARLKAAINVEDRWDEGMALTWDGLTAHIAAGVCIINGNWVNFGSSVDKILAASDTNYIYAKDDATIVVNQSGVGPANSVLLHTVTTDGSTVTGAVSNRDASMVYDSMVKAPGFDALNEEIVGVATPTTGTSAANKDYVDTFVATSGTLKLVRVIITSAVTLATDVENGDTQDGVVLATGDVILLTAQAAPAENGPYIVAASGAPTRATYLDSSAEANALRGALFSAFAGTANSGKVYKHTTTATITLDTTALTFAEVSVTSHAALTSAHGSTAANTPNAIMQRNGSGQTAIGDGVNADHAVTLGQMQAGDTAAASANSAADRARANHTGTQTAATISDFDTQVRTNRLDQMAQPTASVDFNAQRIIDLGAPVAADDAATKGYVDDLLAGSVKLSASPGYLSRVLVSDRDSTGTNLAVFAAVAASADGMVRVAVVRTTANDFRVVLSTDGGNSWALTSATLSGSLATIAIFVESATTWSIASISASTNWSFSKTTNGGTSYTTNTTAASPVTANVFILMRSADEAHFFGSNGGTTLTHRKTTNAGSTFSSNTTVTTSLLAASTPSAATVDGTNILVTFLTATTSVGSAFSGDGGGTWGSTVTVATGLVGVNHNPVTIAESTTTYGVFYTDNPTAPATSKGYWKRSTNSGTSWTGSSTLNALVRSTGSFAQTRVPFAKGSVAGRYYAIATITDVIHPGFIVFGTQDYGATWAVVGMWLAGDSIATATPYDTSNGASSFLMATAEGLFFGVQMLFNSSTDYLCRLIHLPWIITASEP